VLARTNKSTPVAGFTMALNQKKAVRVVIQYLKIENNANITLNSTLRNTAEEAVSINMHDDTYHLIKLSGGLLWAS